MALQKKTGVDCQGLTKQRQFELILLKSRALNTYKLNILATEWESPDDVIPGKKPFFQDFSGGNARPLVSVNMNRLCLANIANVKELLEK